VIGIGVAVVAIGVAILLLSRLGIHRLPGDTAIHT
jgi:multisubunit Na+/H+ antiporter MnhG subunit